MERPWTLGALLYRTSPAKVKKVCEIMHDAQCVFPYMAFVYDRQTREPGTHFNSLFIAFHLMTVLGTFTIMELDFSGQALQSQESW